MARAWKEWVYATLTGQTLDEDGVPGVENAYANAMPCQVLYEQVREAYDNLLIRLGEHDEDPDVETIISTMMEIEMYLSGKMFEYGAKFARISEILKQADDR